MHPQDDANLAVNKQYNIHMYKIPMNAGEQKDAAIIWLKRPQQGKVLEPSKQ